MIESIKNLVQNLGITINKGSIALIVALICVIVILYVLRKTPTAIKIITDGITEAERSLNGEKGQEKLDVAVDYIRGQIPFILKFFVSKYTLVTVIEILLTFGAKFFDIDKKIDIIGNDGFAIKDVNANIEKEVVSFGVAVEKGEEPELADSDSYVYGALKGKTDFRGNDEASIEFGIKKKI